MWHDLQVRHQHFIFKRKETKGLCLSTDVYLLIYDLVSRFKCVHVCLKSSYMIPTRGHNIAGRDRCAIKNAASLNMTSGVEWPGWTRGSNKSVFFCGIPQSLPRPSCQQKQTYIKPLQRKEAGPPRRRKWWTWKGLWGESSINIRCVFRCCCSHVQSE